MWEVGGELEYLWIGNFDEIERLLIVRVRKVK